MFYRIDDELTEIKIDEIDESFLTAGFISAQELPEIGERFGFSKVTVDACRKASKNFRSDVEIHDRYLFTELRIADPDDSDKFDCVALYILKNMIIVVDVEDFDSSTKSKFFASIRRYSAETQTVEKLLFAFFDALVSNDFTYIENKGNEITQLEEAVIKDEVENEHVQIQNLDLSEFF